MPTYGYARVSTKEQSLISQTDVLTLVGCNQIYSDIAGGAMRTRPGFNRLLDRVHSGDTIVVVSLDRFSRSLQTLITEVGLLDEKGIQFRSLREDIDTSTPTGKLFFHFMGAIGEFERARIRERTMVGLQAAAALGRKGGRPTKITKANRQKADKMLSGGLTKMETARALGVSRATLYRLLKRTAE